MTPSHGRRVARKISTENRRAALSRGRKVKALLAGGLVLGIGSAATMAAWTDNEASTASFGSGTFAIQTSVDGQNWDSGAQMKFNASNMYPGSIVYAPVFVRTTASTSYDAEITASAEGISTSNAFVDALVYKSVVQQITPSAAPSFSCGPELFTAGAEYAFGTPTGAIALKTAASPNGKQVASKASSNVLAYCFQVQLKVDASSEAQGKSATHTWTFAGQSKPPASTP